MSNKQTAVEFLVEQLEVEIILTDKDVENVIKQAKELEKQQELKKWLETWSAGYDSGFNNCMKKFNNK
jgi:UDP-N-acetylenolpyruvoylglucosamine reductase